MGAGTATRAEAENRWSSRPRAALLIRVVAALTPVAVSVLFVAVVSRIVERPSGWLETAVWWILLTGASTAVLVAVERGMRRFLPLAALFRMSLAFPDQAPSRYKAAMRTRTLRQLQRGLAEGQIPATAVGVQESAERLLALAMALNDHDRMTRGHTERVRAYTLMIGEEMGLPEADLDRLHWAGLVHDIGKLEVPPHLLNKPGRPSDEEWEIIKRHPDAGLRLVEPLRPWLGDWADAASQHHERWDGKGYPFGLAGTETSLSGRIVAVADAYDVMTSVRSYKTAMSAAEARAELARCAGTQFDPEVVRAFLNISLGRLRLVMGPFSWLAEFPVVARAPVGAAGTAASSLAAMTFAVVAGLAGHHAEPPVPLAVRQPVATAVGTVLDPPAATTTTTVRTRPSTSTPEPTSSPSTEPEAGEPPVEGPVGEEPPPTTEAPPEAEPPTESTPPDPTPPEDPTVTHLQASTAEDTPVVIDLGASDLAARRRAAMRSDPEHGDVVVSGSTATYTPTPNWAGVDSFTVETAGDDSSAEVTVTVAAVNDVPIGFDTSVSVDEDQPMVVDLGSLTADADGDPLVISSLGTPGRGDAVGSGLVVTYTPDPDTSGTDTFSYAVADPDGATAGGTVTVVVDAVDDPPLGLARSVTTSEDTPLSIDVSSSVSDADGDALTIAAVGTPGDGSAAATAAPLTVDYADPQFHGTDQFVVTVTDPAGSPADVTVTVTVTSVNDIPSADDDTVQTDEDQATTIDLAELTSDLDGDALTVALLGTPTQGEVVAAGLQLTYTPDSDTFGTDTFTYMVADPDGAASSGTITVDVAAVQDAPVAQDDAYVASPILPFTAPAGSLLENDFDVDGDTVTVVPSLTGQGLGLVSVSADGSFVYTSPLFFSGTDTFTYAVTDGTATATATVSITVTAAPSTDVSYLRSTPSATVGWSLGGSPGPTANPEPDTSDGDSKAGTTIRHSNNGLAENDVQKYLIWSRTFGSSTQLSGPVTLDLWSMVHDGEAKKARVYAWVFDCVGSSCTQLLASNLYVDPWNVRDTWTEHNLVLGSLDTTIAAGHDLRLRLQVDNNDLWIAQSGSRPSSLTVTTG